MSISTPAEVKAAETSDLLALYNKLTQKSVKKFADRASAERQTLKAIEEFGTTKSASTKKKAAGKRDGYDNRVIKVLVQENPKRPGTRAFKKFAVLLKMDGKTIKELKKEEGRHPSLDNEKGWPATELRWATKLELVKVINAPAESKAA